VGAAVASVLANDHPNFDLTVVDQSTTDSTAKVLEILGGDDQRLTYVSMKGTGASRARNLGIKCTSAPIIAFTDDDCIVPEDWLRRIEDAFDSELTSALLYGQVIAKLTDRADNSAAPDHHVLPTPSLEFSKPERLSRRDGFKVFGMSANFAARRRLFDEIGCFDEALGVGGPLRAGEDFDLSYRAFRAGATILLRPEITLLHDGGREPEEWPSLFQNYGIGDGAFYSKHVRCGDIYALTLLVRRVFRQGMRTILQPARGQRLEKNTYLAGLFTGIRYGLRYRIDKSNRRYVIVG
jgi:GT2 family glycosyltransferase